MLELKKVDNIIDQTIQQLKKHRISVLSVPTDLSDNISIVRTERELGLRKVGHRGYDVISDSFFVEETLFYYECKKRCSTDIKSTFTDFETYYSFIDGEIYDDSCYWCYEFSQQEINKYHLDVERLHKKTHFIEDTIDNYRLDIKKKKQEFKKNSKNKGIIKEWIKRFIDCNTYEELCATKEAYEKTVLKSCRISKCMPDLMFFFSLYAFSIEDENDKKLNALLKVFSLDSIFECYLFGLCTIFNPVRIMVTYTSNLIEASGKKATYKKRKGIKDFVNALKQNRVTFKKSASFDPKSHYYCEDIIGVKDGDNRISFRLNRYFETFDEFISYREGNLCSCDLKDDFGLERVDFTNYSTDSATMLPINLEKITYHIEKKYENGVFIITQKWQNEVGKTYQYFYHKFCYFFDLIAFLKGDLRNSDLGLV